MRKPTAAKAAQPTWVLDWQLLCTGALLLLLLAVLVLALVRMNKPIVSVQVQGELSAAEQADLSRVVSARLDQGILSVNLAALVADINALAWPRSVEVRRQWPNRLHLRIEREAVAARWGSAAVLTTGGEVIPTSAVPDWLPLFQCARADGARAMQVYQQLRAALTRVGLEIRVLHEDELGDWSLTLENGLVVMLGREELAARLERFLAVYDSVLAAQSAQISRVDARYDNGIAVAWQSGSAPVLEGRQLANRTFN